MNFKKTVSKLLAIATFLTYLPAAHADIYKDNRIPNKIKAKIEKIVDEPSHLAGIDNFKRKPRKERIKDNIRWYKKHGEVNNCYNRYALDIKNYRNSDDFMISKQVGRLAVHHGNVDPKKHRNLILNKMVFEKVVKEHYPGLIPSSYFKFQGNKVIPEKNILLSGFEHTKSALESLKDGKYFVKEVSGSCGDNAILLIKEKSELSFRHVTKGNISLEDFLDITSKTDFMVQEHVENHNDIKKLSPFALSTIRIVTMRFHDEPQILSADMRVSCQKNAVVDNYHQHGAIVHVDTKTGRLAKYAHRLNEKSLKVHPISKIKFEGYQLPYWQETLDMVKKLHNIFPEFSSLGWDVAITPTGPKIIESNYGWYLAIPQVTIGGVKARWEKLKNM